MHYLKVYFVTDEDLCAQAGRSVLDTVIAAVNGGATCVQLRAKDANAGPFLDQVMAVCEAVGHRVPVIVNDRIDVYLAARERGAFVAGVHIGQSDLPVDVTRALIGPDAILGLSAATFEEIAQAEASGMVNYLGTGVLRGTPTKLDAPEPLGVKGFAERTAATTLPMVAIGGIGADDLADLAASGLDGAAVVSVICCADDPEAMTRTLVSEWERGLERGACSSDGGCGNCGCGA